MLAGNETARLGPRGTSPRPSNFPALCLSSSGTSVEITKRGLASGNCRVELSEEEDLPLWPWHHLLGLGAIEPSHWTKGSPTTFFLYRLYDGNRR